MKNSKHHYLPIFFISIALFVVSCTTTNTQREVVLPPFSPIPQSTEVIETQIPYPILLLHGLGQKAEVWNDANALKFYKNDMGLGYGGALKFTKGVMKLQSANDKTSDFFTVSFSSPYDSIGGWARELSKAIDFVRQKTNSDKVILIGYSMGGVAARYHLILKPTNHHVKRLITIGSPHQGSAFAKAYNWKTSILKGLADNPNMISKAVLESAKYTLEKMEQGVPFESPAVGDLREFNDYGFFLYNINRMSHPGDVEYISVIGKVDFLDGVSAINSSLQEIIRRGLDVIGKGGSALFKEGDGVVSVESQNMAEIPWFKADRSRQKIARSIVLKTVHLDHLTSSNEIQRLSLEEQPELKGADFHQINGKGVLIVDFIDYLPAIKTAVKITVKKGEKIVSSIEVPKDKIKLVRKRDGRVVLRAIYEHPDNADWMEDLVFDYTITNSFGNSVNSSKIWDAEQ